MHPDQASTRLANRLVVMSFHPVTREFATMMQARTANKLNSVPTFYRVAMNFVPRMLLEAKVAAPSGYEPDVFQYWFCLGVSPEQAEELFGN